MQQRKVGPGIRDIVKLWDVTAREGWNKVPEQQHIYIMLATNCSGWASWATLSSLSQRSDTHMSVLGIHTKKYLVKVYTCANVIEHTCAITFLIT